MLPRLLASFPGWFFLIVMVGAVTLGTFAGGAWAALGIGSGIILFIACSLAKGRPAAIPARLMVIITLILLGFCALNLQAAYPVVSWLSTLQEATIFIPLALLFSPDVFTRSQHPAFFRILTFAALAGIIAIGAELALGGPLLHLIKKTGASLSEYNRGVSYLALFSFPLLAHLWLSGQRKLALLFFVALLFPVSLTESRATKAALLVGLGSTALAMFFPAATRWLWSGILCALTAFPLVITGLFLHYHAWLERLPPSWFCRTEIWDYMAYRIFERPLLGWGLGSSYLLPFQEPHGQLYTCVNAPAGHPHNIITQLWVELGGIGLIIGIAALLWLLHATRKLGKELAPFALGAWVTAFVISLVAYSFWDDSLFAAFALTSLAFVFLQKRFAAHS